MEIAKSSGWNACIYVIDGKYQVVYFNEAVKHIFPSMEVGDVCYTKIMGMDSPCEDCPILNKNRGSSLINIQQPRPWQEIPLGSIDWPGAGPCTLMAGGNLNEEKRNLFYNMTQMGTYDELFELNFTANTYKILFHKKDKYMIPAMEGDLDILCQDVADHMIHPDDRERFLEFWDRDRMVQRLGTDERYGMVSGQFRKRLVTGGYCWAAQLVLPLCHEERDDQIVMCFIQDIDDQKKGELKLQDNDRKDRAKDKLTGLYRKNAFFENAEELLVRHKSDSYCVMAIDIEHFKLFNEWYGQNEGDKFLINIGKQLKQLQEFCDCVPGYIGGDDFVIVLPDDGDLISRLQKEIMEYVKQYGGNAGFLPAFGIYPIGSGNVSVSIMYDRALIALASIKGNYAVRTARYDEAMKQKMEKDQVLLSEVQRALERNEFLFYAQPQCNMMSGKIIGLEALIRWRHPVRGLVPPDEFIPLLEKNGFITNLDLWMWEQVCLHVRAWIDAGNRPVPISVNVSRIDIYAVNVVEVFQSLVARYHLDPSLLEIEITEGSYVEDNQVISKTVNDLRQAGFTVLMDDFGSGYSSLNMLKDVNVDILKIDIKFLDLTKESVGKGVGILEAIVKMAKLMNLRLIAEGVETKEQAEFLLNIGCRYGQGYYFYRPMPVGDFESLIKDPANVDFRGVKARQIETLKLSDLFSEATTSETMLNNMMGGIAFYDIHDGVLELLRVNEQYYRVTGGDPIDLAERRKTIIDFVHEEDKKKALAIFLSAKENLLDGAEGDIRRHRINGEEMWMHIHVFFFREQDGHDLFYGVVSDITEKKMQEQELKSSQQMLKAVLDLSEKGASFMKLAEENRKAASSIFAQMSPGGMIGGYCEEGFPLYFANNEMISLLGYNSYEEFSEAIDGKVANTIHPDDLSQVTKDIGPVYYDGLQYSTKYRMPKKDGTWFWTLDRGKVIKAEDGRLAIVSACMDITETMQIQQQLQKANETLKKQNEELNFLNGEMPGGYHRCELTPDFDFIFASQRFLEIFGYTEDEIKEKFDNKFINMVHPGDRQTVQNAVFHQDEENRVFGLKYRMLTNRGYIWVADQTKRVEQNGKTFLYGVILEISEVAL